MILFNHKHFSTQITSSLMLLFHLWVFLTRFFMNYCSRQLYLILKNQTNSFFRLSLSSPSLISLLFLSSSSLALTLLAWSLKQQNLISFLSSSSITYSYSSCFESVTWSIITHFYSFCLEFEAAKPCRQMLCFSRTNPFTSWCEFRHVTHLSLLSHNM